MDSAALLDLLGNENRRRILRLLARKPCYVTEISEYLGVSPKAVIDHLRKLEEAGLVEAHVDDGRRKYFSITRNLRLEVSVSPYDFGTKSAYSASPNLDVASWRYVSLDVRGSGSASAENGSVDADGPGSGVETVDSGESRVEPRDAAGAAESSVPEPAKSDAQEAAESGGSEAVESNEPDAPTSDGRETGEPRGPEAGDEALSTLASDLRELERLENELSMAQRWVQGRLTETLDRISAHFEGVDGRFYAELLRGLATGPATPEEIGRRVDAPPEVVDDALEGLSAHGVVEQDGDEWRLS